MPIENMVSISNESFWNKKIFLTGHTSFKVAG